jgi:hypothetical protein
MGVPVSRRRSLQGSAKMAWLICMQGDSGRGGAVVQRQLRACAELCPYPCHRQLARPSAVRTLDCPFCRARRVKEGRDIGSTASGQDLASSRGAVRQCTSPSPSIPRAAAPLGGVLRRRSPARTSWRTPLPG